MDRRGTTLALHAAVLVALLAGCGGGQATSAEVAGDPISAAELALAASTSGEVESARFSFDIETTMAGFDEPFSLTGSGAMGEAGERVSLSMDLSSLATLFGPFLGASEPPDTSTLRDPDAWQLDAVQDGEVSYVRFPAFGDQLPEGKSWIRADDGSSIGGELDFGQLSGTGPTTFLELLEGVSGEVETVGAETLRGVETTHYRATLDPESVERAPSGTGQGDLRDLTDDLFPASELMDVPLDVWLDAEGLIRKFLLDASAARPDGAGADRATMSFELWDVGEPVEIELPPSDQVVDAESVGLGG